MAKNYIGIDWGERKVGVAYGEVETGIAFALTTLEQSDQVFAELELLAQKHGVSSYIVGVSMMDNHNDNSKKIYDFAQRLKEHSEKEVVFAEEMMSTREAQENLKQANHKKIDAKDDAEAARVILQSWMDHADS